MEQNDTSHMTLSGHINELKKRIINSFIALALGCVIAYFFKEEIYNFLLDPLANAIQGEDRRMIYTGLAEAFVTYIKLALFAGTIIAFPFIAYQVYSFIAPGLYKNEKSFFVSFLVAAPSMFVTGAAFVYYFLFPLAWKFFLSFETAGALPVQLEARVSEYLSLVTTMILAFGLSFQLPIILILLMKIGFLEVETLKKGRRYAIVLLLIIAAVLTPPDILSQIALFTPLYLLYEISILIGNRIKKPD